MRVHVLGSGAGGGFPQWNCNCRNCRGLTDGTLNARARTQSSITLSANRTDRVLFNAPPDIRAQLNTFPALQPGRASRDTAICAVMLIDSQIDHTTGLNHFRSRARQEYALDILQFKLDVLWAMPDAMWMAYIEERPPYHGISP